MYAIVDIAGQQFKVEKDQKIFVHRLEGEEGSKVNFDQVLLVDNDGKVTVGSPVVSGMVVSATIQAHMKADKIKVFKKKRRKGYKNLNGHRQFMTELLINNIGAGTAKAAPKAKAEPKATAKKSAEKPEAASKAAPKAKAETKPAAKKAAPAKKAPSKPKAKAEAKPKAAPAKKAAPTAKPKAAAKAKKPADKKSEDK